MKLVTVSLNDGNEVHGHVQSERDTDDGVRLRCVDEDGLLFDVTITINDDEVVNYYI